MTVHSDKSQAIGVMLAGPCCNFDGRDGGVDKRVYGTDEVETRFRTFGDFNLTVTSGKEDASIGVLFVGNKLGGLPTLKLLGKTTITADKALASQFWERDDGVPEPNKGSNGQIQFGSVDGDYASELTLNGTVDEYTGYFVQYRGTKATVNGSGTWFGGMAKFYGGTMSAPDAVYDTTVKSPLNAQRRLYLMGEDVDLTLKGMKIGDLSYFKGPTSSDGTVTFAKMYGGQLNLETLSINQGGKLGVNAGTITVTGEGSIAGKLRPTTHEDPFGIYGDNSSDIISDKVEHSSASLVTKGAFTVEDTGVLEINEISVDGGTFTNRGKINANNRDDNIAPTGNRIFVGSGATFTNEGNIFTDNLIIEAPGTKFVSTNAINSKRTDQGESIRHIGSTLKILDGATYETSSSELFVTNIIGLTATWREILTADEIEKTLPFEMGRFTLDLRGGKFVYREADETSDHEFDNFLIEVDETDDRNKPESETQYPRLLISAGTYDWKAVTAGHLGTLEVTGGELSLEQLSIKNDGAVNLIYGTLQADQINVASGASGSISIRGGTLTTFTDQIFAAGLNEEGSNTDPEALRLGGSLVFNDGTIAFNDARYNFMYADKAGTLLGASDAKRIVFNGQRVDDDGKIDIGQLPESGSGSVVESNVTAIVKPDNDNATSATVNKSIGVSKIEVSGDSVRTVTIVAGKNVTLVGSKDADGEVITFADTNTNEKTVYVAGNLQLGAAGSANNQGKLSTAVALEKSGRLSVNAGTFTVADVTTTDGASVNVNGGTANFGRITASGGQVIVKAGEASIDTLTASGKTSLAAGTGAKTTVSSLVLDASSEDAEHTLTGTVAVTGLEKKGDKSGVIYVGTSSAQGDLVLDAKVKSLAGLTFFLDPAYADGKAITDGSRLVYQNNTIDGSIVVGENSYVVLGTSDDAPLTAYFKDGKGLKWGKGDGAVLAAAYTDRPITINEKGSLVVDGGLTALPTEAAAAGSASFAANSAFVVDVTEAKEDTVYLTAENGITVDDGAKAVLVGKLDPTKKYKLSSDNDANAGWSKNLYAGNALWNLKTDADGNIQATLQDARLIYGNLMQGTEIATAGMQAGSDYVNALLTDETADPAKLAGLAQRFDAAMNPAGALSVFTTAYDRSSDLRRAVREEAVKFEGNRLWVHLTGGKTKLKGISTGSSQGIHTKTNSYGIVLGGEADIQDFTAGAAFTAGRGDTKNNAVSGKDEFDFYGVSLYGRKSFAGIDVLADVSGTWLKSDLTIGGVADVDTDTTTAVYSAGLQVQKTFELSGIDVTPFVGANLYHVAMDGFNNGHGASIEDSDATAVEFPVGATIAKAFETTDGMKVAPSFTFAVVPTVGDTDVDSDVKFAGAKSTYNFTYSDDVKIRSNLGLDATAQNLSVGLQAGYEWGNEERGAATFQLRAKYAF